MASVDRYDAVTAVCEWLEDEPLWHASLGSKELFHSNLLGWAIERWPELGRRVLEPWLRPGSGTVDQVLFEHRHLDLVIDLAGCETIVVENKTFALPDADQLTANTVVAQKVAEHPVLLLLSLTDPGWRDGTLDQDGHAWVYVSYREIGERLHGAFCSATGFAADVVVHHAGLMVQLANLMELVADVRPSDPLGLPGRVHQLLKRSRIADAVGKARAHRVMALIRHRLDERGVPAPAWDGVGFSNGAPLLEGFWRAGTDRYVGWQYQNGQWRLAMVLDDLTGSGHGEERKRVAQQNETYFDFAPLQQILGTGGSLSRYANQGNVAFNAFNPAFVYRYRKIDPETTVATIIDLATAYSQHAADWAATTRWPS